MHRQIPLTCRRPLLCLPAGRLDWGEAHSRAVVGCRSFTMQCFIGLVLSVKEVLCEMARLREKLPEGSQSGTRGGA